MFAIFTHADTYLLQTAAERVIQSPLLAPDREEGEKVTILNPGADTQNC